MPELPEVQTTTNGLNKTVKGKTITDVWTSYNSPYYKDKDDVKNPNFFKILKRKVIGQKILKSERRAKNILIHLENKQTILIHMKMTGHLLYGKYIKKNDKWMAQKKGLLQDPFNSHIRLVFSLDNGKYLAFSDMRKFAKVTLIETNSLDTSPHLSHLGPEPLDEKFEFPLFKSQLMKRPKARIKEALMDQRLISGIGNIYADEILWRSCVHPLSEVQAIPDKNLKQMFESTKATLRKGIDFGGDSMSDYRNIYGEKGNFQDHHSAYRKHKTSCLRPNCKGVLEKTLVGSRSAHFCPVHQKLYK
jgi:formamidopyrimidine-DNA glycosylase